MTTTVNSDMIIYNQLAQTAYLERLQDNLLRLLQYLHPEDRQIMKVNMFVFVKLLL